MKRPHYKLLLFVLLIVGCATKKSPTIINILDGEISGNSITLKTDDIKENCKKECTTFTVPSNEWCDCMNKCSQDVINKISLGNMDMRIYIEECPVNPLNQTN